MVVPIGGAPHPLGGVRQRVEVPAEPAGRARPVPAVPAIHAAIDEKCDRSFAGLPTPFTIATFPAA